jgi:hypothetical protein
LHEVETSRLDTRHEGGASDETAVACCGDIGSCVARDVYSARRREATDPRLSSSFVGPLTIAEVITAFPPPPGFPDPEGAIEAYDSNGDGTVCVMPLPAESINVIDNVART